MHDYIKVGVAVPIVKVADCDFNQDAIIKKVTKAYKEGVNILVFPELSITGYSCGDLFFQRTLQDAALNALKHILQATKDYSMLIALGMPVCVKGMLFSTSVVINNGEILGVVPKTYIPNYNEFYEQRWFSSANDINEDSILLLNKLVPFGTKILFEIYPTIKLAIDICEDLWSPIPPSSYHILAGASIILNLSASNEIVSKREYRRNLVIQQSARCTCAYIYASAGSNESTTDLVFSGHGIIAENGVLLAENKQYIDDDYLLVSHIDVQKLLADRIKNTSFRQSQTLLHEKYITINSLCNPKLALPLLYPIYRKPFVPNNLHLLDERCKDIISVQVAGLVKRLSHTKAQKVLIGISGGLDSTLALLVSVEAFDRLHLDRKGIIGVTMPGFGTSQRTYDNAMYLMDILQVTSKIIDIKDASNQHFKDIEHDSDVFDITYENTQARERTKILMNLSNKYQGLVIGTGDLSELALGWCTYNGDHMSMYAVNASIPKTLIRSLIFNIANRLDENAQKVLFDILHTPVSPELLPLGKNGEMTQKTEDTVGPYELHDFFLYYMIRYGFSPQKIYFMAQQAFSKKENPQDLIYTDEIIKKWLRVFYQRFFSQQFKRNCMPDGPKVGSICLSPRGDWRMPSDASVDAWEKEISLL